MTSIVRVPFKSETHLLLSSASKIVLSLPLAVTTQNKVWESALQALPSHPPVSPEENILTIPN